MKFVWSSPPCESHSRGNWCNLTRGCHHREFLPGRPPRNDQSKYAAKARAHDSLTRSLMGITDAAEKGVMENPDVGLDLQEYIIAEVE